MERLDAQLLRLKLRGRCEAAPGDAELAELTQRPGDPLVARVAQELHRCLKAPGDADPTVVRLALSELHQTVAQLRG